MNKKTIAAGAAAVALTGSLAFAGTAAADSTCGPGAEAKVTYEMVTNPQTGKKERAKVTTCPDVTIKKESGGERYANAPAPGTGGLIFRDQNGRDLGSGMGEGDTFQYLDRKTTTADGTKLIYVKQITKGNGGWGNLYQGWVRQQFVGVPSAYDN
ncbi:hypothetical protein SEA_FRANKENWEENIE_24 [Streptomyces phage Frankenweenie]|nr:hypothetical protein SEA_FRANKENWEENIE_24 [Streptomyces phage Frankenweenie]